MRLPNAILGQHYACDLPVTGSVRGVDGLEGTGLRFDQPSSRLLGIPQQVGDFLLRIHLHGLEGADAGTVIELLLIINPDPRSLWVAQPSDRAATFAKPDSQHGTCAHAGMKAHCASLRGRAHAQVGGQREDEALVGAIEGRDWMYAVVADGAGSAKWSREGSRLACQAVAGQLAQLPSAAWIRLESLVSTCAWDMKPAHGTAITQCLWEILSRIVRASVEVLQAQAAQQGCLTKDFATTLVMGLVWAMPAGRHFIATWGIGDSPAILLNTRLEPDLLHTPEEGEFSGETHFLTDDRLLHDPEAIIFRTDWRILPDFHALVLMSDGVYDAKFETQHALLETRHWQALWPELQPLVQAPDAIPLLHWLDFWSRGNHDDRSIAFLGILEEGQGARGQPAC